MIAIGIDVGGTKIAAQVFAADWSVVAARRVATPATYSDLLAAIAALSDWSLHEAGRPLPLGIAAAGLMHPKTGIITAANLPTHGMPFLDDLRAQVVKDVVYLNDSAGLALSEARFGAGQGARRLLAIAIGTGVSGAIVEDGQLKQGLGGTLGEFGHIAAPAHLVAAHGLPILKGGCGQPGAIETLISGPGLSQISDAVLGQALPAETITEQKDIDPKCAKVWGVWCALVADLMRTLTHTVDPDRIVLGGGLSQVTGVAADLSMALDRVQFAGFPTPGISVADGGDASCARGAAYAAWQATQ
ncbi:MAG: ROK family protein [Pseudomonadota bacterium]